MQSFNPKVASDQTLFAGDILFVPCRVTFDQNPETIEEELSANTEDATPNKNN